jgi:hypothetical protein
MATTFRGHAGQHALALILGAILVAPAFAGIGELDTSFGIGGRLNFPTGFRGLKALPDGRLQLLAIEVDRIRVLRLDPDGRPDAGHRLHGCQRHLELGGWRPCNEDDSCTHPR